MRKGENLAQVSHVGREDDSAEDTCEGDSQSLNKKTRRVPTEGHYKNINFENNIIT